MKYHNAAGYFRLDPQLAYIAAASLKPAILKIVFPPLWKEATESQSTCLAPHPKLPGQLDLEICFLFLLAYQVSCFADNLLHLQLTLNLVGLLY